MTFGEPIFLLTEDSEYGPAEIRLEAAFHAGANGELHRHTFDHSTGAGTGTSPLPLPVNEAQRVIIYRYVDDEVANTQDNNTTVDDELRFLAESKALEYAPSGAATVTYPGLINVNPDGAIRQIVYVSSKQGATTTVAVNRESASYAPTLEERRRRARLEMQTNLLEQVDVNTRRLELAGRIT